VLFPFVWRDGSLDDFARAHDAEVAKARGESGFSLSPASLLTIPAGKRLVLPSPNGSTLSLATGSVPTFAGSLRNAAAVARAARRIGPRVAIIPAGERWPLDDTLRPALEDWLGAGAIVEHLDGLLSPEAQAARDAFRAARPMLMETLEQCMSGRELVDLGFRYDVELSAELCVSEGAPKLVRGAYVNVALE